MVNEKMKNWGTNRSAIRELFEYGRKRRAQIGAEKVFDFSLGNPSVGAPEEVGAALATLIAARDPVSLHGYTSAQGDAGVRGAIADYLNRTYGTCVSADCLYLTAGAAASLTIALTAVLNEGDEVVLLSPYFPEYRVFVERTGASVREASCRAGDFQPDFEALAEAITEKTRAIIVNSPNNPTGAVLTEESARALAALLTEKSKAYGEPIYLISDEPYRELVWGGVKAPYLPNFYADTISCYSFSKSLSLPGERIGYVLAYPQATDFEGLYAAICGAGRSLGFVCAPALFQYMLPSVLGKTADASIYDTNRRLLLEALTAYGFEVVPPDGAFYLFVKSPEPDAKAFCERAKAFELLIVPSDSFGCSGYARVAYCVTTEQVKASLPAFKALAEAYGLKPSK